MRAIYNYSPQQELLHRDYGEVDKCIDVMCDLIHYATDDADLLFQAKNGLLKREIKVPDAEFSSASGRKLFLINILNNSVSLKNQFIDTSAIGIYILAYYRDFTFHLSKIDKQLGMIELMNKTLPVEKQLDENGEHIGLCHCNMNCGHSETVAAYSKCKCRKGLMQPKEA
ncbi:hypothetical protein JG631_06135 [Vibrio cholerae]|uniref:hypothetical protein n=1 Tax=Vibrio cholerae TaxID=666 RepID=UPI0018F0BCDE|nr:hypothetical protein [Vibrio cholerae]MBJ6924465.1 hypothetical protein [Vibrio cholerae]MBJ6971815.1 hypothetical protein [Vibrio cholerae]